MYLKRCFRRCTALKKRRLILLTSTIFLFLMGFLAAYTLLSNSNSPDDYAQAANLNPNQIKAADYDTSLLDGLITGRIVDPNDELSNLQDQGAGQGQTIARAKNSKPYFVFGLGPNNANEAFYNPTETFDLWLPDGTTEFKLDLYDLCHSFWGDEGYGLNRANQAPYVSLISSDSSGLVRTNYLVKPGIGTNLQPTDIHSQETWNISINNNVGSKSFRTNAESNFRDPRVRFDPGDKYRETGNDTNVQSYFDCHSDAQRHEEGEDNHDWVIPLGWRKPLEIRQFNTNTGGYGLYKLEVGLMAGGVFVGVGTPPWWSGSPIDGFRGWANDVFYPHYYHNPAGGFNAATDSPLGASQRNHYYNQYKLDVVQPADRILTLSRFEWDFECQNQYNADGSSKLTSLYVKPTPLGDSCETTDSTNALNGVSGADVDHNSGIISLGNGIAGIPNRRFNDNKLSIDIINAAPHGGSLALTNRLKDISRNNFSTSQYSSLNVEDKHFYYTPPYYQANDNPLDILSSVTTTGSTTTGSQEPHGPYMHNGAPPTTLSVLFGENTNRKGTAQKHEAYDKNLPTNNSNINPNNIKWETEIIFAPDCETIGNPILKVGLRAHDGESDLLRTGAPLGHVLESAYYDSPSYSNVTIAVQETDKTDSIYQANTIRLDVDNISWNNVTTLSHQPSLDSGFRGEWHNYSSGSLTLDPDKIYKVTVSNLSIQQFYQIRLPFEDMADVYKVCDETTVEAEVVCKEEILFFRILKWDEHPGAQIEVKFIDPLIDPELSTNNFTSFDYTAVSGGVLPNIDILHPNNNYTQDDYSGYDPATLPNASIILKIIDTANNRYMNEGQFNILKDYRKLYVTGRYSLDNGATWLGDDLNDSLDKGVLEVDYNECTIVPYPEIRIRAEGCRIYVSYLSVESLNHDVYNSNDIWLEYNNGTGEKLSQPNPPPIPGGSGITLIELPEGSSKPAYFQGSTVTGYFKPGALITTSLDPTLVDVDVDLDGWSCGFTPPPSCSAVGYPQVTGRGSLPNITQTAGRPQPVVQDYIGNWTEGMGLASNTWTSSWSSWSTTTTGTPPNEVETTAPSGGGSGGGTAQYWSPLVGRTYGYQYNSDFTLTETEVEDYLMGALALGTNMGINQMLEHEIDTAASLTHASTHPIKIDLKFDHMSGSVVNIRNDSQLKRQTLESEARQYPYDNHRSHAWVNQPTMTLYIDSYTVKRIRDNSTAASSSNRHTLNHTNDTLFLDEDDSRAYSGPVINGYEWDIDWRFVISETFSGYYETDFNASRGYNTSWGDSKNGGRAFLSSHLVASGGRSNFSNNNTATWEGTYKTVTCTLVVQAPTCTMSVNRGPWHNSLNGNFVPETEKFDPGRDKHIGNSYLSGDDFIVFPVGPQSVSRTKIRVQNLNPFKIEGDQQIGDSNTPPYRSALEYKVETVSAAPGEDSRYPTDGFYPKLIRSRGNGNGRAGGYEAYDSSAYVSPTDASRNGTVGYTPERRPPNVNSLRNPTDPTDNSLNFPGEYLTTWTVHWQSLANNATWTTLNPPSTTWRGGEIESDECNPDDARTRMEGYTYMFAEPATCKVKFTVFDVNNDQTQVEVILENPNNAPMQIDRLDYEINRALSSILANQTGSILAPPPLTIPMADPDPETDVPGTFTTQTPPLAIQRPDNGFYDFNWTIRTSMGNERWTTKDEDPATNLQNSWFEDPDERILGYLPDGTATVDDECREEMRVLIRPYVKLFYGDLAVGGYFGRAREYDACSNDQIVGGNTPVGHLAGHAEVYHGQYIGSSTNYGIGVHNAIIGFYSAAGRNVWPSPYKGLTLGNVGNLNPDHAQWGGQFGQPRCIANYWRGAERVENQYIGHGSSLAVELQGLEHNEQRRYDLTPGQHLNINPGSVSNTANLKATIYADGDVYIQNNIVNGENAIWNSPADIGVIAIIAKGNIYIAPHVTRIDAILVAYPNEVGGVAEDGEIWTCYGYTTQPGTEQKEHFRNCTKQLVVNGALIAQKIRLGRIHGSIKEGTSQISHSKLFQHSLRLEQLADRHYSDLTQYKSRIGYLIEEKVLPGNPTQPESRPGGPLGDSLKNLLGGPANNEDCSKYFAYSPPHNTAQLQFCPSGDENGTDGGDTTNALTPRWQVAVWLARALNKGRDPVMATPSYFTDMGSGNALWAEPHVAYLEQKLGIGFLCENPHAGSTCPVFGANFYPHDKATRLWMAVLLKEAFNVPHSGGNHFNDFVDGTLIPSGPNGISRFGLTPYHREAIEDLYAAGITSGCSGANNYCPKNSSRHELAALLAHAMAWQEVRTNTGGSAASEIINLLPEYWLAAPELPFFEEQLQKSDSFTYDPVNF